MMSCLPIYACKVHKPGEICFEIKCGTRSRFICALLEHEPKAECAREREREGSLAPDPWL